MRARIASEVCTMCRRCPSTRSPLVERPLRFRIGGLGRPSAASTNHVARRWRRFACL